MEICCICVQSNRTTKAAALLGYLSICSPHLETKVFHHFFFFFFFAKQPKLRLDKKHNLSNLASDFQLDGSLDSDEAIQTHGNGLHSFLQHLKMFYNLNLH